MWRSQRYNLFRGVLPPPLPASGCTDTSPILSPWLSLQHSSRAPSVCCHCQRASYWAAQTAFRLIWCSQKWFCSQTSACFDMFIIYFTRVKTPGLFPTHFQSGANLTSNAPTPSAPKIKINSSQTFSTADFCLSFRSNCCCIAMHCIALRCGVKPVPFVPLKSGGFLRWRRQCWSC